MIVHDGKCTFKQRVDPISPNDYSGPAYLCPSLVILLGPCIALENFVCLSIDLLCPHQFAVLSKILHRRPCCYNIMIRFKCKPQLLPSLVKLEEKVEMRVSMYTRRWCANCRALDEAQVFQWFSAEGVCCDKTSAESGYHTLEGLITLYRGQKKVYRADDYAYLARHLHNLFKGRSDSQRLCLKADSGD